MTDTRPRVRHGPEPPPAAAGRRAPAWLFLGGVAVALAVVGILYANASGAVPGTKSPVAWARLVTQDVHSLAFDPTDPQHLYFGHHGGLLESRDGGSTWTALSVRDDAMSVGSAAGGSIVIAGHDVLAASADGGRSWRPISADLPSLDIHGFTRDPGDPKRMWAYPATGGLWESTDSGAHWSRIQPGNVAFPLAVRRPAGTRLYGVTATGLVASDDGGRSWAPRGSPPAFPVTSLSATDDGSVLYAGSPQGLWRSIDGAQTWTATGYTSSAFALATTGDGRTVAVVSSDTAFFRSRDGGETWPGR